MAQLQFPRLPSNRHVDYLQAVILGLVQGLTEFLPISSTAHLRIVPALLGWNDPGPAFSAVIQLGTLVAVLGYFRNDIVQIASAWLRGILSWRPLATHDSRMGWMMIVGTIPIVVCGLVFKDQIEHQFRTLPVIAGALVVLAILLALAEGFAAWRRRQGHAARHLEQTTWADAIVVGTAQALALVPGSSRSGVTITAGLFDGLERETAARFSFLLAIPSIFAAGVFQLWTARQALVGTSESLALLVIATLAALVSGYASIAFLLGYLKKHSTLIFILYRLVLGGLLFYWLATGTLQA
ncbi:MAG TPA: undecaprenyl-diphosphate phosphatase [Pirellulales bacterium]|jgi:undecaprenyl-diphosphatase|nr:undecaprenyl-diphosphate phosphatase [Pirellulales bacterium]